jgi:hypothetical protein
VTKWTSERLDELAAALVASPHVSGLSEGPFGTVASYLPGRRIPGLRVLPDDRVDVHVVMGWGSTVDDVEASVLNEFDDASELAHLVIEDVSIPNDVLAVGTGKAQ